MADNWGEDNQNAMASSGAHGTRASELLGQWYHASRGTLGWAFDAWYDGAIAAVATAIEHGVVDRDALVGLGAGRAARGRSERDALDDLECLFRQAGDAIDGPIRGAARRALLLGFRSPCPRPTWFGDARALSRSLRKLYADADTRRTPPAASHALLLVDVNLSWLTDAERGAVLAAAAECLHAQFPFADTVAGLGEPRFGLVVRRHPGLAVGAESLEVAFAGEPLLAGATTVLLVPLPERADGVGPFVRELAGAQRPLRVRAYTPRAAAGGGPGADLLKAAVPLAAFRPERASAQRRRRLVGAVVDGSGMLGAALAALILAAGVNQVIGPRAIVGTPTTQLFGLAPPSSAGEGPQADPPPVPEGSVVVVEDTPIDTVAVVAASPPRPAAPPVAGAEVAPAPAPEPLPPAPAADSAPEPPPAETAPAEPVASPDVTPSEPDESVATAPDDVIDECGGLSGREARRCERRNDRQERREEQREELTNADDDDDDDAD